MPVTHQLKTWPEYYEPVADGSKKVELRLNDRGFQKGDILHLQEYEPTQHAFTGRSLFARVTHIVRGGPWLAIGHVAMSIEIMESEVSE
jgi:ASC-1-like (ASCH) protein